MKLTLLAPLTILLAGAGGHEATAQQSGTIEYELTARIDPNSVVIRTFTTGGGGQSGPPPDAPAPQIPDIITTKQLFTFSGNWGKVETEGQNMRRTIIMNGGVSSASSPAGSGAAPVTTSLRSPVSNTTYIDLAKRKYLSVVEEKQDSVTVNIWYSEEDYKAPAQINESEKTKTIAGYKCRRASAKAGEETFTIWYTTELPVDFSPVNGVIPGKGVVLAIESSKRSYIAKKVDLKPVPANAVSLPGNAKQLTPEELKKKRQSIMEKFQNEQFMKMQQQQ